MMITAVASPLMMAQKAHVAGIRREPTVDLLSLRPLLRRELEPHAGAGRLAQEAPTLRDLVDELEPASVLVMPLRFPPVRQPGLPVIDDVHVHDRTAVGHRDGHPGGIGRVLDRVRHEFTGQQLSIHRRAGRRSAWRPRGLRLFPLLPALRRARAPYGPRLADPAARRQSRAHRAY